jgi:nucleoid-associated protein YgaU
MGMFEDLLRGALGAAAKEPQKSSAGLVEGILDYLQEPGTGGIEGLTRVLAQRGLGAQANSWIGTGANQPVNPNDLIEALGASRVDSIGQRAGLSGPLAAGALAAILPALIDKLTPDGQTPSGAQLGQRGQTLLGGIFGASAGGGGKGTPPGGGKKADFSNVKSGSSSAPTTPPVSAPPPQQETYTVAKGDSLSKIAKKVYGDANQWKKIFEANKDQIKNPDLIQPGWKLRIPR